MTPLQMVFDEIKKAISKYPEFCDKFCATGTELADVQGWLTSARKASDAEKSTGYSVESTMDEEVLEAMEAYLKGEYSHCIQELAQVATVAIRAMYFVSDKHQEEIDGGK